MHRFHTEKLVHLEILAPKMQFQTREGQELNLCGLLLLSHIYLIIYHQFLQKLACLYISVMAKNFFYCTFFSVPTKLPFFRHDQRFFKINKYHMQFPFCPFIFFHDLSQYKNWADGSSSRHEPYLHFIHLNHVYQLLTYFFNYPYACYKSSTF